MGITLNALKQEKIWCCWNYTKRDGKTTKVPCTPDGRKTGSGANNSPTWVNYTDAKQGASRHHFSGIGFFIPDNMFFLDIDHKDVADELVQTMLQRFHSYSEYSVSGNGIHIYGLCDPNQIPTSLRADGKLQLDRQYYAKNPHNGMELYIGQLTNRFAAFTGNEIESLPLLDCTHAILETLETHMKKALFKENGSSPLQASGFSEEEIDRIIEDMRWQKNGSKFVALYDYGDTSVYSGDDSAADCALCALLAFRLGNDPEAIDTAFRKSALMREKWDREDYRLMTIQTGVEACHGVFHRSVMPVPEFILFDEKNGKAHVSVPLLAKHVRENLIYILVRDVATGATMKYVYEDGCYRLYSDDMFKGLIKAYIAAYDETLVKMGQINEAYQNLITDLHTVNFSDLNADEDLINFRNGLLRLSDLKLLPHDPKVLSTIQLDCKWHGYPTPTPEFDGYLNTLTDGRAGDKRLLLEFSGAAYSNVKGHRMKKALFLVGPGDTGKSLMKSLPERILGAGNYASIDLSELEARFGTSNLYGKRLAGSSDMSFVTVSELKTFKKLTGGDSLFAEFKGMNGFEYTYQGLLWFCMNRLPKFSGDDGEWVYNRIIPIQCNHIIPPEKQDKQLLDKLYAERDGIVYKAVMAFRDVIQNGYRFTEPQSVVDARREYRNRNNTVIAFFEECMTERPKGRINDNCTTSRVYKVYKAWCSDNNNGYSKTAKEFRETFSAHLNGSFNELTVQRRQGTFYKDYTLTDEAKQQYQREYGYDESVFLAS